MLAALSNTSYSFGSTVYFWDDMFDGLEKMVRVGVGGATFFPGTDDGENGHKYGMAGVAAFLSQCMQETIQYDACDENNWSDASTVAEAGGGTHPLRSELVQVLAVVPEGLQRKATAKPKDIGVKKTLDELDEPDLHKQLVRLHARLLEAVRAWSKANAKWSNLLNTAFEMEDNIANIRAKGGRFESDVLRPLKHPMAEELRGRALFYWRVYLKRVATRALAVACAAMSMAILLGSVAMMLYSITQVFPISAAAFQPPWKLLHNNAAWA